MSNEQLAKIETHNIEPTESLIPHLTGANKAHYEKFRDEAHAEGMAAQEMTPRKFEGPFPTGDRLVRTRFISQIMKLDPDQTCTHIKEVDGKYDTDNHHIFYDEQTSLERYAAQSGGPLSPDSKRAVFSPADPFLCLVEDTAEGLTADRATHITFNDKLGNHSGNFVDDATRVAFYSTYEGHSDNRGYFTSSSGAKASELLRPQLDAWILVERGRGSLESTTFSGGKSAGTLVTNRLGRFAANTTQATLILHDVFKGKISSTGNPEDSKRLLREYGGKAWEQLKPPLRDVILAQGYEPENYQPLNWQITHPETGKPVTLGQLVAEVEEMSKSASGFEPQRVQDMFRNIREYGGLIEAWVKNSSVAPTSSEATETRTTTALAIRETTKAIVESKGSVLTIKLPSGQEFTPIPVDGIALDINTPDNDIFAENIWEVHIFKDGEMQQENWEAIKAKARKLLTKVGINIEGNFDPADQDARYAVIQAMLRPLESDRKRALDEKKKALLKLDAAYSVYLTEEAEKLEQPKTKK